MSKVWKRLQLNKMRNPKMIKSLRWFRIRHNLYIIHSIFFSHLKEIQGEPNTEKKNSGCPVLET